MTSTSEDAARKSWRERNSDFKNSWHDAGLSPEPTHAPPAIVETVYEADSAAFGGLLFPASRVPADGTGEEAHVIRHEHVWDSTLEEPE